MMNTRVVSPKNQHASAKPCTSANCCSPGRLWKNMQILINSNQKEEFRTFCSDKAKLPHIVNVILTCRLSNNPLVYSKANTIQFDQKLYEKFGKFIPTDINALELALLQKHDHIAFYILQLLKQNSTPAQNKQFLNHQWGKGGNTALHLAAFWGLSKIVRLMIELGADPILENNRQLKPIDCATNSDTQSQLQKEKTITKRPSLLLKKATEKQMLKPFIHQEEHQLVIQDRLLMSPLSFSSSTSTSTSSLSSFDHPCWTPPTSPLPSPAPDFKRPSCFPQTNVAVLQKPKKVQFDPHIILMEACSRGDKQELISIPYDLNSVRDLKNRSLLHIAIMYGHQHLLDYLYDKVDINHTDDDGKKNNH